MTALEPRGDSPAAAISFPLLSLVLASALVPASGLGATDVKKGGRCYEWPFEPSLTDELRLSREILADGYEESSQPGRGSQVMGDKTGVCFTFQLTSQAFTFRS